MCVLRRFASRRFVVFMHLFLLVALGGGPLAWGEVVSTFHGALQFPSPAQGWSYLWNANGPIGVPANYLPLIATSGGNYTSDGSDVRPAPPPSNFLGIGLQLGEPGGHPGMGALQAGSGGIERYCIALYTVASPNQISLLNGLLRNINPNNGGSSDGLSLMVFLNDSPTPLLSSGTAAGFDQTASFNLSIGDVAAGDRIYVAIGSNDSDSFDGFNLRYDVVAVPEPAAATLLALSVVFVVGVRRR